MVWPVEGEVVMPFSMDAAIRDNTLQQYRLNNHMRIAAEEGDIVRAGADGRVLQVSYGNRMGHFVVVDHGDGWVATYGQLTPATNVREGDIIRTGQIVGTITQPSIFGYYDGPHLHFMLVHDDEHVNPYHFLAGRD
jgi:murein DD-endopeptidase MepM/ murein hydrolase activator NlpD